MPDSTLHPVYPDDEIWSLPDNKKAREHYNGLKTYICGLYPKGLSEQEADEATRNLLGFAKLMLEISIEQAQAGDDEPAE
ncbi:MAG: hypothetical protein H6858_03085 [Rhodospirillales bacterium]|nr:hypothetical protein [Alphaproteobacteria bacterium]MCB9976566.1 hypothetical protein [Rhodospirillales bacterium]